MQEYRKVRKTYQGKILVWDKILIFDEISSWGKILSWGKTLIWGFFYLGLNFELSNKTWCT